MEIFWLLILAVSVVGFFLVWTCLRIIGWFEDKRLWKQVDREAAIHEAAVDLHETWLRKEIERHEVWNISTQQREVMDAFEGRSLEDRISAAVWVGQEKGESGSKRNAKWKWEYRKENAVELRHRLWRERSREVRGRYVVSLLDLVDGQGGQCGDPKKQKAKGKEDFGCGCWLLALPPGAVHVDHIIPRIEGGTDAPDNLQALCQSCNLVKGRKLAKGNEREDDDGRTCKGFTRRAVREAEQRSQLDQPQHLPPEDGNDWDDWLDAIGERRR